MISWRLKYLPGAESDTQTIKGQHHMKKEDSSKVYRVKALILKAAVKQHVPAKGNKHGAYVNSPYPITDYKS